MIGLERDLDYHNQVLKVVQVTVVSGYRDHYKALQAMDHPQNLSALQVELLEVPSSRYYIHYHIPYCNQEVLPFALFLSFHLDQVQVPVPSVRLLSNHYSLLMVLCSADIRLDHSHHAVDILFL